MIGDTCMNILGIHYGHDAGACIILPNHKPIAIALERIDRIKYSGTQIKGWRDNFPKNLKKLVEYCLQGLGINNGDLYFDLVAHTLLPVKDDIFRSLISSYTKPGTDYIKVGHHMAHACSAFFASPFQDSAILVVDGEGDIPENHLYVTDLAEKQSLYRGTGNDITMITKTYGSSKSPFGIGEAYEIVTYFLNFAPQEPGKTMGLAPYGSGCLFNDFQILKIYEDGEILMNPQFFHWPEYAKWATVYDLQTSWKIIRELPSKFKRIRQQEEELPFEYYNEMAYKVQKELEGAMLELSNRLYKITRSKNLCIAGGVGLNSVANKIIWDATPFDQLFIQPAASDTGLGLGVALYGKHIICNSMQKWIMSDAYLGREYSEEEVTEAIGKFSNIEVKYYGRDELNNYFHSKIPIFVKTAQLLAEGMIIGWFQGGSELGPRALGHRSILADSRDVKFRDIVNFKVKHRESFRPFAPSILFEHTKEYYDLDYPSPFMLLVAKAKKSMKHRIPAVNHIDDTGRVQTVTFEENGIYYNLIKEFYRITNVPVILNTSFNVRGEPIVETPTDALNVFLKTHMDYLVLHNYLNRKQ